MTERPNADGCVLVAMHMAFHRVVTKRRVEEAINLAHERLKADRVFEPPNVFAASARCPTAVFSLN
jgi:hypothetical protein